MPRPPDCLQWVNQHRTNAELDALRRGVNRGTAFGDDPWVRRTAVKLGLEASLRPRG